MRTWIGCALLAVGFGCAVPLISSAQQTDGVSPKRADKVVLTDAEWKKKLTPAQYKILRTNGTEAAFCGRFHDSKKTGIYSCAGCDLPLFASNAKFDSGTGWPSFFQPVVKGNTWKKVDRSFGMVREEVNCSRCDGHLGHVFDDGPSDKGGLRFCINSDGLTFKEFKGAKLTAEIKRLQPGKS